MLALICSIWDQKGGGIDVPRTGHQLNHMHVCLAEDQLHMVWITLFQLSLQIPTAVLVLAQVVEFTLVMLQGEVGESSQLGRFSFSLATLAANAVPTAGFVVAVIGVVGVSSISIRSREARQLVVVLNCLSTIGRRHSIVVERREWHGGCGNAGVGRSGCQLRAKRNSVTMQQSRRRLAVLRSVRFGRVPALAVDRAGGNPTHAGIVTVKVLGMSLGRRDSSIETAFIVVVRALDCRQIIGRVRRLQGSRAVRGNWSHGLRAALAGENKSTLQGMPGKVARLGCMSVLLVGGAAQLVEAHHPGNVLRHALVS